MLRVGGGRHDEIHSFEVFGPKALAGIGDLPDTVADRSITIALHRKPRTVSKERFRLRKVSSLGAECHDLLARALAGLTDKISHMDPELPDELNDREQDTWELLLAVADIAGANWPAAARRAAIKLAEDSQDATETVGVQLLGDMKSVWREDERALPSHVLVERLTELEEAPWADWWGKPIDPRFLATKLRPYGVKSTKVKYDGKPLQGYRWEHLAPVWDKYVPATGAEPMEPAELPLQDKGPTVPHAMEPVRNPDAGSGPVPDGFHTETPYGATEVPQVPEVPHKMQVLDADRKVDLPNPADTRDIKRVNRIRSTGFHREVGDA